MTNAAGPTGAPGSDGAPRIRRQDIRLVAIGVVAVLLVWFALDNFQDVQIHFWVQTARAPLVVVILISGILGALVGALIRRRRAPAGGSRQDR